MGARSTSVLRLGGPAPPSLGRLSQLALDDRDETLEVALQHVVARPGPHGGDRDLLADRAGDEDERYVEAALPQERKRCRTAELRHGVIADHDVPLLAVESGAHCGGRLHSLDERLEAAARELADDQQRVVLGILD